ncbi:MAG: hypothetical protein M1380_06565 [Chloroflexi bacterium]|nr:hypothetical protein [Chloroflexota bacterium]
MSRSCAPATGRGGQDGQSGREPGTDGQDKGIEYDRVVVGWGDELVSVFKWTARVDEAAMLVALDELSNEEIAKQVGITRQGLDKWKRRPDFQEKVGELTAALAEAVKGKGIAERQNHLEALNERWKLMHKVIEERAVQYAGVPGGGSTGLLVPAAGRGATAPPGARTGRSGGVGERVSGGNGEQRRGLREFTRYVVDVRLLKELREHEKQAARELGQWKEESGTESNVLIREYVGVPVDEV